MGTEKLLDAGDHEVLAIVVQRGRLRGSDSEVGMRYGLIYTVEGRKIRAARAYVTAEEALEAVGLRE